VFVWAESSQDENKQVYAKIFHRLLKKIINKQKKVAGDSMGLTPPPRPSPGGAGEMLGTDFKCSVEEWVGEQRLISYVIRDVGLRHAKPTVF